MEVIDYVRQNYYRLLHTTKPDNTSEIRIVIAGRKPNKVVPMVYVNPNNRKIFSEIEVEEEN